MVGELGSHAVQRRRHSTFKSKCANCSVKSTSHLAFTDALPKWMDSDCFQDTQKEAEAENHKETATENGCDQAEVTCKRSRKEKIVTVFDALVAVFEFSWKNRRESKTHKENLRLCRTCASCLSQVHAGLLKFKLLSSEAKPKSYLHPIVFGTRSRKFTQSNDYVENFGDADFDDDDDLAPTLTQVDHDELPLPLIRDDDVKVKIEQLETDSSVFPYVKDPNWSVPKPKPRRKKRKLTAPVIRRGIKRKRRLKREVIQSYVCKEDQCSFETQCKIQYNEHLSSIHGVKVKDDEFLVPLIARLEFHSCVVCGSTFISKEELDEHCSSKHVPSIRVRPYSCLECSKTFFTSRDLRSHAETHMATNGFSCSQCPFKTRRPQELNRHLKLVHVQDRTFFCGHCGKGFVLRWQLVDHERRHHEKRSYQCTESGCEKTFKTPANLRQHLELHRGSKYVCDICGQSYTRKAYLRLHMNGTHLMLPLPQSVKRQKRNKESTAKPPRTKSGTKRERVRPTIIVETCVTIQDSKLDTEVGTAVPSPRNETVADEETPEQEEVQEEEILGLGYSKDNENTEVTMTNNDDSTFHDQVDLGSTETEEITQIQDAPVSASSVSNMDPTNTFTLPDGHQLICYPMGMNIISTEGGNTYYITTTGPAPEQPQVLGEEPESTPITVFGSLTDFLSSQQ